MDVSATRTRVIPFLVAFIIFSTMIQHNSFDSENMRKGPYLIYPGNNTVMTILWQTNSQANSTIEWGKTDSCSDGRAVVFEKNSGHNEHQFSYTITNLTPASRTYYKVIVDGVNYNGSFLAAPDNSAESLTFYAYGDTRSNPGIQERVISRMMADIKDELDKRQTFCLHAGDWVDAGNIEYGWDEDYFNRSCPITQAFLSKLPVMGCCGNHERTGELFRKYWLYPFKSKGHNYYSFDYGPVHVAVVDQYSAEFENGSAQYEWLKQDLNSSMKFWKIVMFHEPAWSATAFNESENETEDFVEDESENEPEDESTIFITRHDLAPLFKEMGVSVVISGHKHLYARCEVNGIQYITLAGGGAPLYNPSFDAPYLVVAAKAYHFARFDISGNEMKVTAISIKGETIDSFTIKRGDPK